MTRSQSGEVAQVAWSPDAREDRVGLLGGALAPLDLLGEGLLEHRQHAVGGGLAAGADDDVAPVAAATSAMPPPMIPDPRTPTFSKPMGRDYVVAPKCLGMRDSIEWTSTFAVGSLDALRTLLRDGPTRVARTWLTSSSFRPRRRTSVSPKPRRGRQRCSTTSICASRQ